LRFHEKTAVVTGAGGGIGLAVATALAREGCRVTCIDLKPRPEQLPEACEYVTGDITDADVPGAVVERAADDGRLDYLVNAAAVGWFDRDRSILDTPEDVWHAVLEINLTAPMRFMRAAVPAMPSPGGAMVHIGSIAALRNMDSPMDAYQVSKSGLVSLSRSMALQLAAKGIRSNTICPGAIDTPMVAGIYAEDPSRRDRMAARTPMRRLGRPDDIAGCCLYLLSDEASFMTGTDVVVDGGLLSVLP
jgi:NAD(P)-dependent dehydrogenase (short-subunit alcohol dehydrogenase family)